jgi:4-diphosphocytidyl-2-C-methyl-D-erythritol kinase
MRLYPTEAGVTVQAPAKINLFFEVLGRRDDGYHEIESLMCPIDLCDTIEFCDAPGPQVTLSCALPSGPRGPCCTWLPDVPEGPENLVLRGVELLRRQAGIKRGAAVRLIKRIPTAAGLGGGSSDAAAVLAAANACWKLGYDAQSLGSMAAELGSDVPFFFARGPAICRGRGERVEAVAGAGMLHFVVVRPPKGLSTAAVYRVCQPARQPESLRAIRAALAAGDWPAVGRQLFNRLEEPAATLSPYVRQLRAEFDRLDCLGHAMSGSGSSYFGLCRNARHARRVARRLQARNLGSVYAVRSCA